MRVSLNWLKDYIEVKGDVTKIHDALTMAGLEVTSFMHAEEDHVMDIEITPNRADCLSMLGVARELGASLSKPVKLPLSIKKSYMKKGPGRGSARVNIMHTKGCSRYVGCVIKDVKVGPSPEWLVKRLNAMGVRSINNIVDITNYVMFETGQPLHAFDLEKLAGKKIVVRKAGKNEKIVTIDGVTRELDPDVMVIADEEKPVAIAGIMGGKDTEISEETKNVFLESAYFDPVIIRRMQRKLVLASESSYRFERDVDFGMVLSASIYAQELIKKLSKGKAKGSITDVGGKLLKPRTIDFSLLSIKRVLGIDISSKEVSDIFKRLGLAPSKKGKDKIVVKVPSYRKDLEREIDLVEEVVRLYGYEKVPSKLPSINVQKTYKEENVDENVLSKKVKAILSSSGLNEIVTYSLNSRFSIQALGADFSKVVRLKNPLSSNQEFMRPTLLSEMLETITWNINRRNPLVELFEISKVYLKEKDGKVQENINLAIGICGTKPGNWKDKERSIDFFDLKGIVETLFDALGVDNYILEKSETKIYKDDLSIRIKIGKKILGYFGEVKESVAKNFNLKHKVYLLEIGMEELLNNVSLEKQYKVLPKYPSIERDISILADETTTSENVFSVIQNMGKNLVRSIDVFDLYKGEQIGRDKKSLSYRIEYRSDEKTLKDEDIAELHKKIQEELVKKLGGQIR